MHRKLKKKTQHGTKTCQKGPKEGSEYLLTSKTSHCVHGIPIIAPTPGQCLDKGGGGDLVVLGCDSFIFAKFLAANFGGWQTDQF